MKIKKILKWVLTGFERLGLQIEQRHSEGSQDVALKGLATGRRGGWRVRLGVQRLSFGLWLREARRTL